MNPALSFLCAMVVTMAWLPVLVRASLRMHLVDMPGLRKVHSTPIPRIGGLAMATGVLVAAIVAVPMSAHNLWLLVATGVIVLFGALDDRFNLDYRIKLAGQCIAVALVMAQGGVLVESFTLADRVPLPVWVSVPLTAIFLVGITNAINLADGLDGLAGGTTFLCLCAIALLSSYSGQGSSVALSLAFAGAVLGFLRFNTYPATVFMGDAGSQMLGFATGVLSVRTTQSATSLISTSIPILLLAIPILDTLSVMIQRLGEGRSPFSPDRNHLHHKLLALGFEHHEAVAVIYGFQALLFVLAYRMRYDSDLAIAAAVTLFFAAVIGSMQLASRAGWRLRSAGDSGNGAVANRSATRRARMQRLGEAAYRVIAATLAAYAAMVIVAVSALREDFRHLVLALLAVLAAYAVLLRAKPLSLVEKAAIYVTATVIVFLDTVVLPHAPMFDGVEWVLVGISAAATALRLRLANDRRFQLTPLDLIVLFMALIVPSLLGSFAFPAGAVYGIVKLVIVLYALEVVTSGAAERAIWLRIGAGAILAGLVVRPFLP
ncbi:MAG: undecaprenyl/decaprenyl-phosphate alpha-N-acetylglucosaminyl 1-phosphate transferase [Gammaproteobacteria bacterium]|nr:undecaprenyl/decaprenyl-phosphate alpha-N-acetylglucosaminyl 1-phosphate transferase [Gammaproteobacteria bacterium]